MSPISDTERAQLYEETGLACVGRMPRTGAIYINPNHDKADETFTEYLMERNVKDTFAEYGVCRPTYRREMRAISRYGLPTVEKPPSDEEKETLLGWLENEYGHYVQNSRVLDFDEVDMQGRSTPGIPYKWYSRTKTEARKVFERDIIAFWDKAHLIGYPVIWHNFVKEELLDSTKLAEDNVRSITGPDIAYFTSFSRICQDFNHKFYTSALRTSSAVGFNKYYCGINALAERINRHPHKEEADMSKYDARQARWIRELCMEFRWRMLNPRHQTPENRSRLEYYYDQAIKSYFATGLGYVFYVDHGMMSGDPNTTVDNTLIHFMVVAYSYMQCVSKDYGHFKKNVVAFLYGDDELLSMSDDVVGKFSASIRAPHYERCGVHFKLEQTKESIQLEGLSFLGVRFIRDPSTNLWVGTPVNPRKMVASALKPLRKQRPGQSLVRAIALLCESYWDKWARNILHGFVKYSVSRGIEPEQDDVDTEEFQSDLISIAGSLPTLNKIRGLWLGYQ